MSTPLGIDSQESPTYRGVEHGSKALTGTGSQTFDAAAEADAPYERNSFHWLVDRMRHAHDAHIRRLEQEIGGLKGELAVLRGQQVPQDGSREALSPRCSGESLPPGRWNRSTSSVGVRRPRPRPIGSPNGSGSSADLAARQQVSPRHGAREAQAPDRPDRQMNDVEQAAPPSQRLTMQESLQPPPGLPPALADSPSNETSQRRESKGSSPKEAYRRARGLSGTLRQRLAKLEEMRRQGMLARIVSHWAFDMFISVSIALYGCVMAAEAQYAGFDLARNTRHRSAGGASVDVWPDAVQLFEIAHWTFGVVFAVEIVFKMIALRCEFVFDVWNWIDLCLVLLWVCQHVFSAFIEARFSVLRIARLARLIRLVKLLKYMTSQKFDSLYLLTTSLRGSALILMWSLILLLVMHLMLALVLNQVLAEYYFDSDPEKLTNEQAEVYEYYGSFTRAFITMFEITMANWPQPCRVLMENVHEVFIIYSVMHKMVLGFAIVGIINGVFVQETFKVATLDDSVMVRQAMRKRQAHQDKMQRLFDEADVNEDGHVSFAEWINICKDEWVQIWLCSQDLDVSDAELLFHLLDNGEGALTASELIQGTARLKGSAASVHLASILGNLGVSVSEVKSELRAARGLLEHLDGGSIGGLKAMK